MAKKAKKKVKFNIQNPSTWSWDELNRWLMAPKRTIEELRRALSTEEVLGKGRLTYQLRIQARINRMEGAEAKRKLLK